MFKGTNLSIFLSNTSHCLLFGCKEYLIVVLICIYLMANKNGWTFFPVFTSHFHTPSSRLLVRSLESTVYNGSQSLVSSLPSHTQTHTHTHPAVSPSPEILLENQVLRPYPRSPESEILKIGPRNLCFNKLSKWLQTLLSTGVCLRINGTEYYFFQDVFTAFYQVIFDQVIS